MLVPVLKKKSPDCHRKLLFYEEFLKRQLNKNLYVLAYFSEQRNENQYEWSRKAFFHSSNLIFLPSAYTLIKDLCIQGPKIFIIIINSVKLTSIIEFSLLRGIVAFIHKKWYAFFVLRDVLIRYASFLLIIKTKFFCCVRVGTWCKKTFSNLEKFSLSFAN